MTPVVQVDTISKAFRQGKELIKVLELVSLEIGAGEIVSLMGKSGSGKTTLLDILGGMQLPDSGTVVIDGHELTALSESERTRLRRRQIGMVFQFFNLIPTLTGRENIAFALQLNERADPERVESLMERLEVAHRADAFPETLSGGEQQRFAIARAIAHDPKVILADEPTGNLDDEHSQGVLAIFRDLCRNEGVALVLGTHSEDCAAISDRVLHLRYGKLR